jgi:N-acetylglucosaminyldiphosphoundecaprenol N-acetyl-beta-D-mannosaminyltransferase
MEVQSVSLFGISLHRITMHEAIALLFTWMQEGRACRYVVTPNVDHVVKLQKLPAMQSAYRDAALVVADGWPLVAASRWLGQPLPERVAGSDLVPNLLAAGHTVPDFRVFLLGAAPGVAEKAAEQIHERWQGARVCGVYSPPPGFESDPDETARIVREINSVTPHLLVVGLGAPKQEIWLQQNSAKLDARVAIAAGGTIDFLAGAQRRAPVWIQRLRLEWLFRLARDPRRLARRYALDAVVFPRLVAAEWRRRRANVVQKSCGPSQMC